jgi:hypothetical protein
MKYSHCELKGNGVLRDIGLRLDRVPVEFVTGCGHWLDSLNGGLGLEASMQIRVFVKLKLETRT